MAPGQTKSPLEKVVITSRKHTPKRENGKTIKQGQLERPYVLVEYGKPTHLYFGTVDGPGGFHNSTKSWNIVIPLK